MSAGGAGVVVLGCGNPSRGDDALGCELLQRLERLVADEALPVECVLGFQLQIEHALDIAGRQLVLFVDASVSAEAPFRFGPVAAQAERAPTTHALSPGGVLEVLERVQGQVAPPAFVLAVRGTAFELGEGLSPAAAANLEVAWQLLQQLVRTPSPAAWRARAEAA